MLGVAALAQAPAPATTQVAGPSSRRTTGTRRSRGWSAPTTCRRPRSTSWRCGRPTTFDPKRDRPRTRLGRRHRHEHDARVPARPAVAAGRRGLHAARIDQFLGDRRQASTSGRCSCCSTRAGIRTRSSGTQRAPKPGVHNSGWVQSPGAEALQDPPQCPRLEAYVKGVVGAFANDARVLAWDMWNEPDNTERLQLRRAGAGEQGGARAGAAAAGVRLGAQRRGRRSR